MPPENDQPLNNDVQIAPSHDNVIDPANPPAAAPLPEGAATYAEFEAAAKAAEEAGEAGLFKAPDKVEEKSDQKVEKVEEKSDTPAPKADAPKKSAQERIAELSRRKGEAERAVEAKDAELKAALDRIEALERGEFRGLEPAAAETKGPTPDDKNDDGTEKYPFGELDTKYIKDLARHEALETVREERTRQEQTRQEQAAREAAEAQQHAWADQLEAAAAELPDFVDKVINGGKAGTWPCNREVGALLQDSEVGAQIAYHLATNLREAVALDSITDPVERARSFGRLEATLQAKSKTTPAGKTPKTPSADAPVPQARGSNGAFTATPQNFKDFEAKYQPVLDKQR